MKPEQNPIHPCDSCGKENPNHEWANYCDECRDRFHSEVELERKRTADAAQKFWETKPY